jgi:hypothetical protein
MARTKKGEAARKWGAHLEAWDTSGVSLSAFATREGLNVRSLYRWKTVLRGAPPREMSFAPVVVTGGPSPRREGFELALPDGVVLRIPSDFDEATLGRIVRALGASR